MDNLLDVFYHSKKVGTLFINKSNKVCFKYSEEWLKDGFSISPLYLPLEDRVFVSSKTYFNGLFGVFADSFVDSWGELLIRRYLKTKNIEYDKLNILEKLSLIGKDPMGALEYFPNSGLKASLENIDLDELQNEINSLFENEEIKDIDKMFLLGGSSSGTRPKILTNYKEKDVIIKFSSKFDPADIAELEYKYMLCAKKMGINIPYIELLKTENNKYFLIERFDRNNKEKIHMISVSGLLEVDYKIPSVDYLDLIKLTKLVTKSEKDVIEMYRRMVFNVIFENLDDHTKNFAYLYNEKSSMFELSPAFDLTPGRTYFGEHTTSINGKGKNITTQDMLDVAEKSKIKKEIANEIIELAIKVKKDMKNE